MNSQTNQSSVIGNKYYMSVFEHSSRFYPTDWNSLYIHTLPEGYHTKPELIKLLEMQLCIGKVKRIDIVLKKHKDGEIQYGGFSAFIHFECWFQNENTDYLRNSINDRGVCDISGFNDINTCSRFTSAFGEPVYIRFSKNTKPILKIEFNTQQISEKLVVAEQTILRQNQTIELLDHRVGHLEYQLSQVMEILSTIISANEQDARIAPNYDGPPGFEDDASLTLSDLASDLALEQLESLQWSSAETHELETEPNSNDLLRQNTDRLEYLFCKM